MIRIHQFVFNPFQENTYVVVDEATGEAIVVDAGNYSPAETRTLQEWIDAEGVRIVAAVNTHGHIDHIAGVQAVKDRYAVPFALHASDRFLVDSARMQGGLYGFRIDRIPQSEVDLAVQPVVKVGESELEVIHTPGHTPGHVCLYHRAGGTLLTGDTLFRESIGRTDLPGGDYSWIMHSILEKIVPLGGDVRILPGHGPESTVGHETLYNPFIVEVLQGQVGY